MPSSFAFTSSNRDSQYYSHYPSPFSSRDHLIPHSDQDTQDTLGSTEMAWFTIRNDNWTAGSGGGGLGVGAGFAPRHNHRPMSKQRRIALLKSYVLDWVICIVLAAIFFALDEIPGFKRQFSIEDPTIRFPYAVHERVPPLALYFIALIAPLVIQITVNFVTVRSLWDLHNSSLGLLLGLTLTGAITQFTKVTVGRPRPDVLSRCEPPAGIVNPEYGLVTVEICTQTDVHMLRDGFRSFPSGHSSLSFAGLGFLSFYLAGKLHLFDEKGHTTKAWISLAPLSGAALVAISRTMDYRHHWQDVLVGSLIGLVMSFFAYRQYYPPLGSPRSHRPFSPRIRREGSASTVDPGEEDGEFGRDISPSDESHAPILPITRPGAGGVGMGSVRSERRGVGGDGKSIPFGSVSGEADALGNAAGGRDRERVLTHPPVPHIHIVHGGHPSHDSRGSHASQGGAFTRYQDEASLEDLHHQLPREEERGRSLHIGGAEERDASGSVREESMEMNSPLRGSGRQASASG